MRMNELTLSEREFLDKVQKLSLTYNKDEDKSLWNVCNAYLTGKIKDDFLSLPDKEIEKILKEINGYSTEEVKSAKKSSKPKKQSSSALF